VTVVDFKISIISMVFMCTPIGWKCYCVQ